MTQRDEIIRVANLAKLAFDEDKIDDFAKEFGSIIQLVEHLQEVDTTGIDPTYHGNQLINVFREDKVYQETQRQAFLDNTKTTKDGFIQVPAIIESEEA